MRIPGRFLVKGARDETVSKEKPCRLLASDTSLSFWGGIDPETAKVVDQTHPLFGETVTDKIFCIPSGRGSCTASQVLLELILNNVAPRAIVMREVDGLACVGALIAQEIFHKGSTDIICVGDNGYKQLLQSKALLGSVVGNGTLILGDDEIDFIETEDISTDDEHAEPEQLNERETKMIHQCQTEAQRMAHKVIFRYHRLLSGQDGERTYLPIENAHIDGCTYIGPGGLHFARKLVNAGGKVCVPTTLNSVSTDRRRWQELQVPRNRALASIELGDAYLELGCTPSFTCAPYLLPKPPSIGQDIAWGESNAVVFANSVLGARTEKLADYLDICCAIAGIVPAVGVHKIENRLPKVLLDAQNVLSEISSVPNVESFDLLFPILGYLCGTMSDGKVPLLIGLERFKDKVTNDHMKAFCAAFGTTGSSPLIHVAGITPEANDVSKIAHLSQCCSARRVITANDLVHTFQTLDSYTGDDEEIKLIALGNPHLSLAECATLSNLIAAGAGEKHPNIRIIACLSRSVYEQAQREGYIANMETFGVEFINDTCWCMLLDEPVIPIDTKGKIMSNSGKHAHYGPALTNRSFRFGSLGECVQTASSGSYAKKRIPATGSPLASLFPSSLPAQNLRRSFSSSHQYLARIGIRKLR